MSVPCNPIVGVNHSAPPAGECALGSLRFRKYATKMTIRARPVTFCLILLKRNSVDNVRFMAHGIFCLTTFFLVMIALFLCTAVIAGYFLLILRYDWKDEQKLAHLLLLFFMSYFLKSIEISRGLKINLDHFYVDKLRVKPEE